MRKTMAVLLSIVLAVSTCGCAIPQTGYEKSGATQSSGAAGSESSADAESASGYGDSYGSDVPYEPEVTWNTEEYAAIVEHGFTSTASDPYSTFSADVDTASYANLRRMISEGYAAEDIPSGAVRIEEMLNYFDYDYADPSGSDVFGVTAQIADCPWNPDTKLLVMGLKTRDLDYAETRGNNLVFLIDTSGSMDSPDKLGLLKRSFSYLVDNLNPDDTVSVVTYAGSDRVILDGTPASDRTTILDALDDLEADGCTNGGAGLERAYDIAQSHFVEGGNNRIILASDGDLNVGMTSESDLSDYVAGKKDTGVYLSVLGFGEGNYKDTKMETLADDGGGNYSYIDCLEEAEKVFGDDLTSTLVTCADDVKLQVEFNPAYVRGYRQVGYENRELDTQDFADDSVDAGEVGYGHSVTVAYEIICADSSYDPFSATTSKYGNGDATGVENGEWLTLNVRSKDPGESESKLSEYPIGEKDVTSAPSDDWRFASAVIEFGMIVNDSENKGTSTTGSVLDILDGANLDDPYRGEFHDLVRRLDA